jgi:hypothetical protein
VNDTRAHHLNLNKKNKSMTLKKHNSADDLMLGWARAALGF